MPSKFVAYLVAFFTVLALPFAVSAQSMKIAAVVNDDIISVHDLSQRMRLIMATARMPNTPEVRQRLSGTVLRTMIDEYLKRQEAERIGITVSDQQIKQSFDFFARSQNIAEGQVPQFLRQIGVEIDVLKKQAEAELAWQVVLNSASATRTRVSEDEVDAALERRKENEGKPEYNYSEIFLSIDGQASEREARDLAQRLIGHLDKNSPFDALARDFSQSPSAAKGGALGWVLSGAIDPAIESILASLKAGQHSQPIRTTAGYYIVELQDKRTSGAVKQDTILDVHQTLVTLPDSATAEQRAASKLTLERFFAGSASCEVFAERSERLENTQSARVDKVTLSKMPQVMRQALGSLQKNQFNVVDRGEGPLINVMVCNRQTTNPQTDIALRNEIRQQIRVEKLQRENRRLIQDLRQTAFLDIRL